MYTSSVADEGKEWMRKRRKITQCRESINHQVGVDKGQIRATLRVQQWTQNSPWVSLVPNARLSISSFGLAWGPRAHKRRYWDTLDIPYSRCLSGKILKVYILVLAQRILFCILPCAAALRNKIPLSQQYHQSYLSRASADHSQLSTLFSCLYVFVINSSSCFVHFFS